jgi:hypothetical protein
MKPGQKVDRGVRQLDTTTTAATTITVNMISVKEQICNLFYEQAIHFAFVTATALPRFVRGTAKFLVKGPVRNLARSSTVGGVVASRTIEQLGGRL